MSACSSKRAQLSGGFHFDFEFLSVGMVVGQAARSVKDGQGTVAVVVHANLRFDVVAAMAIGRNLQQLVLVGDTVVRTHHTLFL